MDLSLICNEQGLGQGCADLPETLLVTYITCQNVQYYKPSPRRFVPLDFALTSLTIDIFVGSVIVIGYIHFDRAICVYPVCLYFLCFIELLLAS